MGKITIRQAQRAVQETEIRRRAEALRGTMNERSRRLWAAAEVQARGHRSISLVARATGMSRAAIRRGLAELRDPPKDLPANRVRAPGAGAIPLIVKDPTLDSGK